MDRPRDDADWRRETRSDLERAQTGLDSIASTVSGALKREQVRTVWLSYLFVEKSVVFIKLELEDENPGRFIGQKQYAVPDERQAVSFALRHLRRAIDHYEHKDLRAALRELRESRNYLRVLLKRVRRQRLKRRAEG